MHLQEVKRQWHALGELDPLWAMTGTNKFGAWKLEEFLHTGDRQVERLLHYVDRYGLPRNHKHVLDFGCGVGRLARGFSAHFTHYLGLDIADSLITKAREINPALPNASFIVHTSPNLSYLADGGFDLVYCWSVFHHIPSPDIVVRYLGEFVRILATDGLLVFTVLHMIRPNHRVQLRRRLFAGLRKLGFSAELLYRRLRLYPQEVHAISRAQVMDNLTAKGASILDASPDAAQKSSHQHWTYYVTK